MSTLEPEISFIWCGGIACKRLRFKRGSYAPQHAHIHDHLSVVASGFCRVEVDGVSTDYGPGDCIEVAAGKVHGVRALTDATWLCLHASDETDPDKIDETLIQPTE